MHSSHRSAWLGVVSLGSLAAIGCDAPVAEGDTDDSYLTRGYVSVERAATDAGVVTNVSAKFLRNASDQPEEALLAAGSIIQDIPEIGECHTYSADALPLDRLQEERALDPDEPSLVQLLNVGDITLRAIYDNDNGADDMGSVTLPLAVRAFPDVGGFASGVFYTSPDAGLDLPMPARYVVESNGLVDSTAVVDGPMLERFVIEADAPAPLSEVLLGGQLLDPDLPSPVLVASANEDLRIQWSAGAESATGDLVYIEFVAADSGQMVRCSWPDVGEATVPGHLLDIEALGGSISVGLHRVHTEEFGPASANPEKPAPDGIDIGRVWFDLSVVGWLSLVENNPT